MGHLPFQLKSINMKMCTIFLASCLMLVSFLNMETSAEPAPEPVPEPDPKDFVLVPLDRSYGDEKGDSDPMFRSAFHEPDKYAYGEGAMPIFRSAFPKSADYALETLGNSGVGQKAQPEFRSGCCSKVKVHYSSSAHCSTTYGPRYQHNYLYGSSPGYFIKQSWNINGKAWFKSGNGRYAIWHHSGKGQWLVGKASDLGSDICYAYTNEGEDSCPEDIYWSWKYFKGQFENADKCFSIYCA